MTKFWMVAMITILFGLTTGCPDGDDDYDAEMDADSDAGSDADADADPDTAEDGTTDESTACPNIAGDWALTYRNDLGYEGYYTLTLEQDGCLVIGLDDLCEYSGTISESGYVSLFRDCAASDRTITGNFTQTPPRMEGLWDESEGTSHGTWWADPQ
ncbi:MAG: hypothetical protein WC445_02680 [Patescibacteria group bacterium]